jgi:chondroitin AC lyase
MRFLLLFLCAFLTSDISFAQSLFETLDKNIKSYYLMSDDRYKTLEPVLSSLPIDSKAEDRVTVELYQKIRPDDSKVELLINSFTSKGTWSDINYNDKKNSGWDPKYHTERILLLTIQYVDPESKYYRDSRLQHILHKSLEYWFKAKLVCPNWWYNEIGVPKTLGPAFIMLRPELSPREIIEAAKVMSHSGFRQTGQNKVWQAGNVLFKAILLRDAALMKRARDTIFSELKMSKEEGIQSDFSFHQHGPQQQFGNYGLSFINTQTFWARMFAQTPLQVEREKIAILRNLMTQGFNWVIWKGYLDINSLGRQFFKGVQKSKALGTAYSMLDMTFIDPEHQQQYLDFIARNYSKDAINDLTGTNHFWRSDMTVHRSPLWTSYIKMSSDRVRATEAINNENMRGYHVGSGTTFITVDGDEYDEIFPYWNWKRLPGVTNFENPGPVPTLAGGYKNTGDFTGGVTNGRDGITAFRLNRDSLLANKAWFHFNDQLICLGSDIRTKKTLPIFTTINQINLVGSVHYFDTTLKEASPESSHPTESIKWIYHDKVGYYYLKPTRGTLISKTQTGNWAHIAGMYKGDADISKPVVTIEVANNVKEANNYAYVVLPATTLEAMNVYEPNFAVVRNDKTAQVIASKDNAIMMASIYEAQKVTVSTTVIDFMNAGLYILEKTAAGWKVHLSDPRQKLKKISLAVNGKTVSANLPQGTHKGKTVMIEVP